MFPLASITTPVNPPLERIEIVISVSVTAVSFNVSLAVISPATPPEIPFILAPEKSSLTASICVSPIILAKEISSS